MNNPDQAPVPPLPRQGALFDAGAFVPESITVGPFGISEDWLTANLGLELARLHGWHGDHLGAPRDYTHRAHRYYYTAEGVRRILQLLQLEGVTVIDRPAPPMPPRPHHVKHSARKTEN